MKTDALHAYVGIKDGTIRAVVVDDPKDTELTAMMLADWVKMGRTIARMPVKAAVARMEAERDLRLTSAISEI